MRQKLIEFLIWNNNRFISDIIVNAGDVVDEYLHEINFDAPAESRNVNENEQKKEDFCNCSFVMIMRNQETDIAYCATCGKEVKEI